MIEKALVIRIVAKPGKEEDEVRQFLLDGLPIIEGEPQTPVWFAFHIAARHSESSTLFATMPTAKRI